MSKSNDKEEEKPKMATVIDITEAGNTVFQHPLPKIQEARRYSMSFAFQEEYGEILKCNGDRETAIVAACAFEQHVDVILGYWVPGYESLNDRETTFSYKIRMLKAFQLIPNKVLVGIDVIRNVRNDFAHNLTLNTFEKLEGKRQDQIKTAYRKFTKSDFEKDVRGNYMAVVTALQFAMGTYSEHVMLLGQALRNAKLFEQIANSIVPSPDTIVQVDEKTSQVELASDPNSKDSHL